MKSNIIVIGDRKRKRWNECFLEVFGIHLALKKWILPLLVSDLSPDIKWVGMWAEQSPINQMITQAFSAKICYFHCQK